MAKQQYTLSELLVHIRAELSVSFPESYWVIAEIGELSVNRTGHCYMELIERKPDDQSITSRIRATIWSYQYRMLKPYFESTTGQLLKAGIKILIAVSVEFHPLYGMSLNIKDIDPIYTIGDQQRKRQEIIQRLQSEGIIDMNKLLPIPIVPQRIAIISSETAAGYGDFMNQINSNNYNYKFYTCLFNAVMQGEKTEESVIDALDRIGEYVDFFDVVVIIRGGGSQSDLGSFDNYWLCFNVAQFPIPVLTGIGHDRDDTILDMVANTKLKTPTAVAEFLITKLVEFEMRLNEAYENSTEILYSRFKDEELKLQKYAHQLFVSSKDVIDNEKRNIKECAYQLKNRTSNISSQNDKLLLNYIKSIQILSSNKLLNQTNRLINITNQISNRTEQIFKEANKTVESYKTNISKTIINTLKNQEHKLELFETKNKYLDPAKILEKGYSITYTQNGKILKSAKQVSLNEKIRTQFSDGVVESTVNDIND